MLNFKTQACWYLRLVLNLGRFIFAHRRVKLENLST